MRLSHLTLAVSDIPRSKAFYLSLGLTPIVDEDHYCRFLTEGDATLSIELKPGAAIAPSGEVGLEFASPQALDARVAALKAAGVAIAEGPVDRSWLWRDARIHDPDGHVLMLFYAGANKLDPPWKVRG